MLRKAKSIEYPLKKELVEVIRHISTGQDSLFFFIESI